MSRNKISITEIKIFKLDESSTADARPKLRSICAKCCSYEPMTRTE